MAKDFDNEFYNELRNRVVGAKTDLEKKKETLIRSIEELESNVVKDPMTLEKLKKELAAVEKQIKQQESEKAVQSGDVIGAKATEKDVDEEVKKEEEKEEKEEEIKDEKDINESEKDKQQIEEAKQRYHDSIIALHQKRMESISKQKAINSLVITEEDFETEMRLEASMYECRETYLQYGKEDPYREKRTEFIKLEKEAREPMEMQLRNMAKRFNEIEQEIKKMDQREQEISKELLSEDINETQKEALTKELAELGEKRKELEVERGDIIYKLNSAIDVKRTRSLKRAGLEEKHVGTLTYEDKKNYDYQKEKVTAMYNNFDEATKQHYQNIKTRIEQREQRIKDINKELKNVPETDFERRLILLNELDKETNMLEADREAKKDLDRGIIPTEEIAAKEAKDKEEKEEDRQEEFDKATDDARAVVKEQKQQIGEAVVENPEITNIEEKDRDATLMAATVAIVHDSPAPGEDTPLQNVAQYAVTKCVISGLEDKVRNPENVEDAKAMVEHDEKLKEAQKEMERVQENVEQKVQM